MSSSCISSSRWYELLGVLDRKVALAEDDEVRSALLTKQATIHEEQLEDLNSAVDCYRQLLEVGGDENDTLGALHRLYQSLEQWEELRAVLEQKQVLATQDGDVDGEVRVRHQLVQVLLHQLDDVTAALDQLESILGLDSDNDSARIILEELISHEYMSVRVALLLEPIYQGRAQWASLVDVLMTRLQLAETDAARCAILRRLVATHRTRTADLSAAFEMNALLLRAAPEKVITLNMLVDLADHTGQWQEAVQLLEDISAEQDDPKRAVALEETCACL